MATADAPPDSRRSNARPAAPPRGRTMAGATAEARRETRRAQACTALRTPCASGGGPAAGGGVSRLQRETRQVVQQQRGEAPPGLGRGVVARPSERPQNGGGLEATGGVPPPPA